MAKGEAREPTDEADPGRHPGFAQHEGLAGGPGSLSLWLAAARCSSTGDSPAVRPPRSKLVAMGLLTFSINVPLDGCVDHQEGIADDETHAFFTRLMDEGGAML